MADSGREGLLLVNLGTPDAPVPEAVGPYLREFLMDPRVIDIPWPARWVLVNLLIVPKRAVASAELYRKVWTERGSPLRFHTADLTEKVAARLSSTHSVRYAMRYGNPSIEAAVEAFQAEGIRRLTVFPLYPQFSLAASQSSFERVQQVARKRNFSLPIAWVPPFYAQSAYLDAVVAVSRPALEERKHDAVLFSFHGLPERQVKKTDPSKECCLKSATCCDAIGAHNSWCYRAHSYATARALAEKLVPAGTPWFVGFQSRLGRTPWIQPYSDEYYRTLAKQGLKRLAVVCPSFVADCLETVEEVQMRGQEEFFANGGDDLFLVPSLNAKDVWAEAVTKLLETAGPWAYR